MTFKVGDKVKCLRSFSFTPCNGTIISINGSGHASIDVEGKPYSGGWTFLKGEFKKIGGEMSKYEDLKQRIEALENGWDKEADDILQEIQHPISYDITISHDYHGKVGCICITRTGEWERCKEFKVDILKRFTFASQCEKMTAFKKALLWLLDNSDIPKVDKEKQAAIQRLEDQLNSIQVRIDELKEEK